MAAMAISKSVKKKGDDIMANQNIGCVTKYFAMVELLTAENIIYKSFLKCTVVLCHMCNRGSLGLNAYNAHRNLAKITKVGANLAELHGAAVFEIPPNGVKRDEQLTFNQKLIDNSAGMLAPINGSERFVSVGAGHMAAGCRAADAGCPTSETTLSDGTGCISLSSMKHDQTLIGMIKQGWEWMVFPWSVEEAWPSFPDLAQTALNASNAIRDSSSELEVAVSMTAFWEASNGDSEWDKCVEAAIAGNPACASYAKKLGKYAFYYGGGKGSPLLKRADAFQKKFNENARLGEEVVTALADTNVSEHNTFVRARLGITLANMTCVKIVDGVNKLHSKGDVTQLRVKLKELTGLESDLEKADEAGAQLIQDGCISADDELACVGRFYVRRTCFLTGKGAGSFERCSHPSLDVIYELFKREIAKAMEKTGAAIDQFHPWRVATAAPITETTVVKQSAVSVAESKSIEFLTAQAGFKVDDLVFEKAQGSQRVYRIKSIGNAAINIVFCNMGRGLVKTASYKFTDFITQFVQFRGEMPLIIDPASLLSNRFAVNSNNTIIEAFRCKFFIAHQHYDETIASITYSKGLQYQAKPHGLFATTELAVGELIMTPFVDLRAVVCTEKEIKSAHVVTNNSVTLRGGAHATVYIMRSMPPAMFKDWKADQFACPYFFVRETADASKANCEAKLVTHNGFNIPIITNRVAIHVWDQLCVLEWKKQEAVKAPCLAGASSTGVEPPAKRLRSKTGAELF